MRQGWRRAVIVLAVAATLGAGQAAAQTAAPAPAPAAQVEILSSAQQAEIDRYVLAEMGRQRVPGLAVGIYLQGRPVLMKGYGLADVEWAAPMGPDTRMQTGSLGKQFVATAIMKLVEEGKVALDASVSRYFPEATANWNAVTVAHLLSHTSGIGSYDNPDLIGPGGQFDIRRDYSEDELATAIAALPNEFEAGSQWSYNNTNYVLLGILIHRVTGQAYGDYLRETFFAPLGMSATRVISDTDVIPRRASGYEMHAGRLRNQEWVSPTFNSTADGTIYTTVEDMGRWERALVEGGLVSAASLEKMWTVFPLADGTPNPGRYGFGWNINTLNGTRRIMHNGSWQGFTSSMTRYPDRGVTVVVFANLDTSGNPSLVARGGGGAGRSGADAPTVPRPARRRGAGAEGAGLPRQGGGRRRPEGGLRRGQPLRVQPGAGAGAAKLPARRLARGADDPRAGSDPAGRQRAVRLPRRAGGEHAPADRRTGAVRSGAGLRRRAGPGQPLGPKERGA